jgi:HPt (histidine-containing phosphotransfer) domain-containing protein
MNPTAQPAPEPNDAEPSGPQPSGMAEALSRMWGQFLPQMHDRVAVLETAAGPMADGTLSDTEREEANAAAHKLAGVLGSFGLPEGTNLAREAENLCGSKSDASPAAAARIIEIAALLRNQIESRR